MDGTVLTFDVSSDAGLIRASDGKRYKFGGSDFSSPGAAQQGDEVDFEISKDMATEIFVTKKAPITGAVAATALSGIAEKFKQHLNESRASAAEGENPLQLFLTQRPALIAAALMMLASLLPWITLPPMPMSGEYGFQGGSVNLYSAVSWASMGIGAMGAFVPASISVPLRLVYLLYAIPVAGSYLLYKEYLGASNTTLQFRTGLLAALGPVGIPVFSVLLALILSGGAQYLGGAAGMMGRGANAVSGFFGFGLVLTMASGIALIAVAKGWNPVKAMVGSFIYLFLLAISTDYGVPSALVVGVGGAVMLVAVLKGWNPFASVSAADLQGNDVSQPATAFMPAALQIEPDAPFSEAPSHTCSMCGHRNAGGDRFCAECGAAL